MPSLEAMHGLVLSMMTPFDDEGAVDERCLVELTEYFVERGVDAMCLMLPLGRGPAMTIEQRKRVFEITQEVAGATVPVIPNIAAADPYTSRELGLHAAAKGALAVASGLPYYHVRTETELVAHYNLVHDAVGLPLVIFNDFDEAGYEMTPTIMGRLHDQIPGFNMLLTHTPSTKDALSYQLTLGDDVRYFCNAYNAFSLLSAGFSGVLDPHFTLVPELGVAFVAAFEQGDMVEAARLNNAVLRFVQVTTPLRKWYKDHFRVGQVHNGITMANSARWPVDRMTPEAADELGVCMDEARTAAKSSPYFVK